MVGYEPKPLIKHYPTRPEVEATYDESLTTPLVQVFSVCISADFDDGKPCQIYGSIRAFEDSHPRFHLYNRDPEDSETIWKKGTLSLIGPDGGAIIPSLGTELELCLYDRIRGVDVVKGTLNLNSLSEDSYDRLIKSDIQGPNGSASVYYVVFQFAIYASLQVIVTKNNNDDNNCDATDIYGSVVVGYENDRMYCSGDEDVKQLETRLFEKWYNKRLCSVVPGKNGFAAVHYAIFHDAIEAFVEMKVFANGHPDIPIGLHGMLIARYSGHDYSTSYQKKYYISRLFDRPQDKPVQLKSGSSIEMLKSIVVVPIKSCLIIEANLRAIGINNVDEPICGIEEFKFDLTGVSASVIHGEELSGTITKVIWGGDYWIEVSVKFQK